MRPYHSSNQRKNFNKSNMIKCNERAAPLLSTTEKIYLIFHDTINHKNGKNNSCAASIFNETHIF